MNRGAALAAGAVLVAAIALPARAEPDAAEAPLLRVGSDAAWGALEGFTQIPNGGADGTTSQQRPALAELGIEDTWAVDVHVTLAHDGHELWAAGRWLQASGSDRLDAELISQAVRFAAGTRVRASVDASTLRFGYRHAFDLAPGASSALQVAPAVAYGLYDFRLAIRDDLAGADVDRAFIKGFAQVGIEARYRPLPALSVDASFMGFPAAGTMPVVLDAGARIGWMPFTDGGPASALELILGVTYQRIDFEDAQPTPNHTRIELGPAALVGAELAW